MLQTVEKHLVANQLEEARVLCSGICNSNPSHAEACFCMSRILAAQGNVSGAIEYADKAASIKPDWFDAWMMISGLAGMLENLDVSEHAARMAVQLNPSDPGAYINLGHALSGKQDTQAAIICYREALRLDPSLEKVRYRIASLGGEAAPARAPDQYIAGLFDVYAEKFEAHLTQKLDYQTPAHIMSALASCIEPHAGVGLNILDLGCGTGLCGELLRVVSHKLVGVDLSSGMLEVARKKEKYDELVEQEVVAYLNECGQPFDVIVAADLLVYLGDLSSLFAAAQAVLTGGGLFVFSVEAADIGSEFELCTTGRYRHSLAYIRELANASAFNVLIEACVELRKEAQSPVQGYIVVLKSTALAD